MSLRQRWHQTAFAAGMGARFVWERASTGIVFNPQAKGMREDPHPFYRRLRETDPVHRSATVDGYVLTRYQDVLGVLSDRSYSAEDRSWRRWPQVVRMIRAAGQPDPYEDGSPTMLRLDPPDHTRLRGLVSKAFSPRAIDSWRPRIEGLAHELLDALPAQGEMELVEALASPLPVVVIAELLGVPVEDRERFRAWSEDVAASLGDGGPEAARRSQRASDELGEYMLGIADDRRAAPRDDLISALVAAEDGDDRLSRDELASTCVLLLVAGNETTTKLIGNGVLALLRNPDALDLLRADPKRIEATVEEILRYDGTVQFTSRFATEDAEIAGRPIRRGQQVALVLAAANRDPDRFPEPDRFDITREDNRHLAFSHGTHFCVGSRLARLETQIAIEALVTRLPGLTLGSEAVRFSENAILRGPDRLPLRY